MANKYRVIVQAEVDSASLERIQGQLDELQRKIIIAGQGAGAGGGGSGSSAQQIKDTAQYTTAITEQQGAFKNLIADYQTAKYDFDYHLNQMGEIDTVTRRYTETLGEGDSAFTQNIKKISTVNAEMNGLGDTYKIASGKIKDATQGSKEYQDGLTAAQPLFKQQIDGLKAANVAYGSLVDSQGRTTKVTAQWNSEVTGKGVKGVAEYKNAVDGVVTSFENLPAPIGKAKGAMALTTDAITAQQGAFKKLIEVGKSHNAIIKTQETTLGEVTKLTNSYTDAQGDLVTETTKFNKEGTALETVVDRVANSTGTARDATKSWSKEIVNNLAKTIQWGIAMAVVYGGLRSIKEGIAYISELNKELTNVQIVTGMSGAQVNDLAGKYNKLAQSLGATTLEVASGSLEWFRQGKTVQESQELVTASIMMSKLANMESAQATEYLTAIINGFKLKGEDVIGVMDRLVALDNAYATSVSEISEAMQRSSNSAQQAGVSLDELASYIK